MRDDYYHRMRSPRTRAIGAAGVLGAMLGFFLAGKILVWTGTIELGVTPNRVTLSYWWVFVIGALLVGTLCSVLTSLVISRFSHQ